jgi:hypothetical protein
MTGMQEEIKLRDAKQHLKDAGLSYRTAAPKLGITYQHLNLVLNGHRQSRRVLQQIMSLPKSQSHN